MFVKIIFGIAIISIGWLLYWLAGRSSNDTIVIGYPKNIFAKLLLIIAAILLLGSPCIVCLVYHVPEEIYIAIGMFALTNVLIAIITFELIKSYEEQNIRLLEILKHGPCSNPGELLCRGQRSYQESLETTINECLKVIPQYKIKTGQKIS